MNWRGEFYAHLRRIESRFMNFFDAFCLIVPPAAGLWGFTNGGLKMALKLFFIVAPSLALAYFGTDIASMATQLTGMLKDRISAPLGLVGASSGLLGMVGIVGAFFLGSRIIITIMDLHAPGQMDRSVGALIGVLGAAAISLPILIFTIKTFPEPSKRFLGHSVAWPYLRPAIVAAYPRVNDFIDQRMAGLVNGLSDNDFIARLALSKASGEGGGISAFMTKVGEIDIQEVLRLQKAARALDPKEVEKLLAAYKSGDMSRERLKSNLENPNFDGLK